MNLLMCIILFNYCLIFLRSDDDQIIFDSAESKEIIKQIHRINNDGTYTVGYEADDGSFKIETRDVLGNIKGSFGYIDDKGTLKRVTYTTTNGKRFNFTEEVNNSSNDISKITIITPSATAATTTTTTSIKNINTSTIKPLSKVVQLIPKRKTDHISSKATISATTNIPIIFSTTTKNQILSKAINHENIATIHESKNSIKSNNQIYKNHMNLLQNTNDFDDVYNIENTRPLFTTLKPIYNRAIEPDRIRNNFMYYPSESSSQLHETKYNQIKDFDERISKIKPPVTTSDFQLLLDYLLLKQDRLKQARKLFMLTTSTKNLLYQSNIGQTKQPVPIIDPEKIQQPTILMILPLSTTYNEGHKYLPILSTSRHNELSENPRQVALIQKRQLTGNYNGQEQQQQKQQHHINIDEKGNHLLPFDVREMLLLRMLQLAINPDLSPLPYSDNDLIQNKQLDANNYNQYQNQEHHNQIRNLEIIQDNEQDQTAQKNRLNFIRQNQYQNPIYMNY